MAEGPLTRVSRRHPARPRCGRSSAPRHGRVGRRADIEGGARERRRSATAEIRQGALAGRAHSPGPPSSSSAGSGAKAPWKGGRIPTAR
eukprot:9433209-Pyramimonas_sp.AAC.1